MKFLQKTSLSRLSSGLTAVVCAGILVNAILTDNGGTPQSQANWKKIKPEQKSFVETLDKDSYAEWRAAQEELDRTVTNSLAKQTPKPEAKPVREEPSVLSLIRENVDVAPSVSNGTNRVSVTVKKGDTLFAISQRHGLTVAELARLNALEEPYTIRIGQTLYVAR
ncbi:MAG: LysM peptidoglycan-binding domain-containing protein [Pseudomonadota bacterium]